LLENRRYDPVADFMVDVAAFPSHDDEQVDI